MPSTYDNNHLERWWVYTLPFYGCFVIILKVQTNLFSIFAKRKHRMRSFQIGRANIFPFSHSGIGALKALWSVSFFGKLLLAIAPYAFIIGHVIDHSIHILSRLNPHILTLSWLGLRNPILSLFSRVPPEVLITFQNNPNYYKGNPEGI